jgi:hypothetical protein
MPNKAEGAERLLQDCPLDIERAAISSARQLLGVGYVDSYYASAASEFMWLYRAGIVQGRKDQRKKQRKAA